MQPDPAATARRILIVDFDVDFAARLSAALVRLGYGTQCAATHDRMLAAIAEIRPQLVVCDVQFLDGLVESWAKEGVSPNPLCVAMARKPDLEAALNAFRLGACDFLLKDCAPSELKAIL